MEPYKFCYKCNENFKKKNNNNKCLGFNIQSDCDLVDSVSNVWSFYYYCYYNYYDNASN